MAERNQPAISTNSELGHVAGKDAELFELSVSKRARIAEEASGLDWDARLDAFLRRVECVCSPDHFIIGGGTSKKFKRFEDAIAVQTPIHAAWFLNNAGFIGAAAAAAQ